MKQSRLILSVVDSWWLKRISFMSLILLPWSILFMAIVVMRKALYRAGIKKQMHFNVPVVVVGNFVVGGTGKTPLVLALVKLLVSKGYKPGIVSRGYGVDKLEQPIFVHSNNDPSEVGDEPVLLANRAQVPMVVCADRPLAVQHLLNNSDCDIVLSDDGMQHFPLGRDIEIVVVDGERKFGNGLCLPAGPLREPLMGLNRADWIVCNGKLLSRKLRLAKKLVLMTLVPQAIINVSDPTKTLDPESMHDKKIHAVAGIGNPGRFFKELKALGFSIIEHPFPDHYRYKRQDLDFGEDELVVMTEKDAVKCKSFLDERHFYVPIEAELSEKFSQDFLLKIKDVVKTKREAK